MKFINIFENLEIEDKYNEDGKLLPSSIYKVYGDADVSYEVLDPRLIVKYNVEDDSNPTMLYIYASDDIIANGAVMFDKVELDGVELSISDLDTAQGLYQLSVGEHIAKYTLKDPTLIGLKTDMSTYQINVGATFARCTAISEVTIPNTVTTIGMSAFYNCSGLTSITIPNNVTTIGSYAFQSCSLTSITIPDSVTFIGEEAFGEICLALTSFINNSSLDEISNEYWGAIIVDSNDNGLLIKNNSVIKYIGKSTDIIIPDGVTSIGDSAFRNNTSITSVTIPNGVTSIGNNAFRSCEGLTSVTIEATTPPTLDNSNAFENTNNCPIYVPSASVEAYKAATNWSSLANRIQAIP